MKMQEQRKECDVGSAEKAKDRAKKAGKEIEAGSMSDTCNQSADRPS